MRQLKPETQLLTMCSTRNRPEWCKRMIDSYFATKRGNSQIAVYISTDDPRIQDYMKMIPQYQDKVHFHVGRHKYMLHVLNYFSTQVYPNVKFYQQINDDHVYITQGWDIGLMRAIRDSGGWGIANAWNTIDQNPGGYVMSGNIVRTLGFFAPRCIRHTWGDDWTFKLGKHFNFLFQCNHITIDHMCWHDGKRGFGARVPKDANMDFVYGHQQWAYGCRAMNNYYAHQWPSDLQKIRVAREKNEVF